MNGVIKAEFRVERPLPLLRALPPPEAFPVEALGDVLGPAAEAIQDAVQSPWAMCSQAVLAAATLAVQGIADVELPTGQIKPISNFFLTVAGSGERKSATDSLALAPIRKHEEILRETYDAELPGYNNAKAAWDAARRKACNSHKGDFAAIKAALNNLGPEPAAPLSPLFTCQEPTFEGLCRALEHGQPSIGIFATEGGQFIAGHAMSAENKLKTAAGLSCVWDGETIKRVRVGDGVTILTGRRVSLHLMVQPGVATIMLADTELADQGMLSRCLVTAPESHSGRRFFREPAPETKNKLLAYDRRLHDILQRPFPLATNTRNVLEPRIIRLSDGATKVWRTFADHVEGQIGPGGALEPIIGFANKLPEHAARLAVVLTLVEDPTATEVAQEFMARGIVLAQHYSSEALRLFQGAKIDRELRLAAQLLDWLVSWDDPNVSLPDIYQSGPNAIRDRKTALRLVRILETHRNLVKLPGITIVKGERRRDAWLIVPEDRP
ncbi:MAG: YfjI family protein [Bradyrhizobium sp.]|uniref:YfjI family protein n=1 Tax=Bradyrhizobium sp. TaxID=376 RepID=UPI00271E956D|nr:YfjI family protein [Bradyrhizobium sp.]MDO8397972.1 YfjI family protein [Bradyrhizobium sp.]